jgi:hypothetical protein
VFFCVHTKKKGPGVTGTNTVFAFPVFSHNVLCYFTVPFSMDLPKNATNKAKHEKRPPLTVLCFAKYSRKYRNVLPTSTGSDIAFALVS